MSIAPCYSRFILVWTKIAAQNEKRAAKPSSLPVLCFLDVKCFAGLAPEHSVGFFGIVQFGSGLAFCSIVAVQPDRPHGQGPA